MVGGAIARQRGDRLREIVSLFGDPGGGPITVRLVSCRNDAGMRLAARLLRRLGGGRVALVGAGEAVPDYGVILCPVWCGNRVGALLKPVPLLSRPNSFGKIAWRG